jgi:hypothetical protein
MSEQKPVDPGAHLVKRVRMMMAISGATTLIALAVILSFIGYRVFRNEGSGTPPNAVTAPLPKDARIISTTGTGGRLAVTMEINGAVEIRVYDMKTLKALSRLHFVTEP